VRKGFLAVLLLLVALLVLTISLLVFIAKAPQMAQARKVERLIVYSTAFTNYTTIPRRYTCDGMDVSPPLSWSGAPAEAKSFIVIVEDLDAPRGVFTHWILYGVPGNITSIPEGLPKGPTTPYGLQGVNDFGNIGYNGPCPPPGRPHRYVFKVYAVDATPPFGPGARRIEVERFALEHSLAVGSLVGLYGR